MSGQKEEEAGVESMVGVTSMTSLAFDAFESATCGCGGGGCSEVMDKGQLLGEALRL